MPLYHRCLPRSLHVERISFVISGVFSAKKPSEPPGQDLTESLGYQSSQQSPNSSKNLREVSEF